jgi:hypothetical protein
MYYKIKSSEKYRHQELVNELLDLCETLPGLKGRSLIAATCELYFALQHLVDSDDELLADRTLMGFESECHNLPIFNDFRNLCSAEHLARSEPAIQQMAELAGSIVREKCALVVSRFERKDLGILECEIADELQYGP